MIIILAREGQMCNQLLTLATAYTVGLEYNCDVKCPVMDDKLKKHFEFMKSDDVGIKVQMYESKIWYGIALFFKLIKRIFKLNFSKEFNKLLSKNKNQYFFDWLSFKDDFALVKHQKQVRSYFAFKKELANKCAQNIESIRESNTVLIGVHVRRGDYKTFNGGIWYFEDENYVTWMQGIAKQKNVKFLLCSNEKLNLQYYAQQGLNVVTLGKSDIEDLCYLSMCDYIMGPPSTFSFWAAMYGNKKRCILKDRNTEYTWNNFKLLEEQVLSGEEIQ